VLSVQGAAVTDCGGQVANVMCPNFSGGADPTGASDSTAAIQSAVNALGSGGTLFFPHGTFLFTGVSLPSNSTVRCADPGTILETPAGGNYILINGVNVNDVSVENCQLFGQQTGSNANGILIQFQCSTNIWIHDNYVHDSGINLGIDTNSPTCATSSSNHVHIYHNIFGPSHVTTVGCGGAPCAANIHVGDGAFMLDIANNTVTDNLAGQLMIGCDGCSNSKIHDNTLNAVPSTGVSACIQLEATSANVTDVQVQNNWCFNQNGSQAGIFAGIGRALPARTLANITLSGNHIVNCNRGEDINDFNGGTSSVVQDIKISNEQIIGTTSDAAIIIWKRQTDTFQNIKVTDVQIDGCGTADGSGGTGGSCLEVLGTVANVQFSNVQQFNIPGVAVYQGTGGIANNITVSGMTWLNSSGAVTNFSNYMGNIQGQVDYVTTVTPSGTSGTFTFTVPLGVWQITLSSSPTNGSGAGSILTSVLQAVNMGAYPATAFVTPYTAVSNTNTNNGQNSTWTFTGELNGVIQVSYSSWGAQTPLVYIYFRYLSRSPVAGT
jgi:hypothetical protein